MKVTQTVCFLEVFSNCKFHIYKKKGLEDEDRQISFAHGHRVNDPTSGEEQHTAASLNLSTGSIGNGFARSEWDGCRQGCRYCNCYSLWSTLRFRDDAFSASVWWWSPMLWVKLVLTKIKGTTCAEYGLAKDTKSASTQSMLPWLRETDDLTSAC